MAKARNQQERFGTVTKVIEPATSTSGQIVEVAMTPAKLRSEVQADPVRCASCTYYSGARANASNGHCRRYAPQPNTTIATPTAWPIVKAEDWCGEHVRKAD